jgi:prolyl 4-hydroxylase
MLKEFFINCKKENFLAGWFLDDIDVCDSIIEYHNHSNTKPGVIVNHGDTGIGLFVNSNHKDSEDCLLFGSLLDRYGVALQKVAKEYTKKFPYCNFYAAWNVQEPVNLQYYRPGAGFHGAHTERTGKHFPNTARHLVFMTYLNDVTDGGETEFIQQEIKINPRKGLTLIWPADWTYTHRGITSLTQGKYIVTGWFNYV